MLVRDPVCSKDLLVHDPVCLCVSCTCIFTAGIRTGLHFNVQLDKSDNWALGLNTAILLASTFLLQQFAMFGLALFLWLVLRTRR